MTPIYVGSAHDRDSSHMDGQQNRPKRKYFCETEEIFKTQGMQRL